jgi:hypothetical protein
MLATRTFLPARLAVANDSEGENRWERGTNHP